MIASDPFGCGVGASAWHTQDGLAWKQATLEAYRTSAMVGHEGGFIAVGEVPTKKGRGRDGVVWTSSGDGSWTEAARFKNARLTDLVVTPGGFEAIGTSDLKEGFGFPSVWRSVDGTTWDGPHVLSDERAGSPEGASSLSGVRLIFDRASDDAVLMRSEDGVEWEALQLPPAEEGDRVSRSYGPLVSTPTGFVMVMSDFERRSRSIQLWHSPDGRTWTPVAAPSAFVWPIATGPQGIVGFSPPAADRKGRYRADAPGSMYWSVDGTSWCSTSDDSLAGVGVEAAAATSDGRLLVAGSTAQPLSGGSLVVQQGVVGDVSDGPICEPVSTEGLDTNPLTLTAPVAVVLSTVSACSTDGESPTASSGTGTADGQGPTYCLSDLIEAGAGKVRASQALASTERWFQRGPCADPGRGARQDRALLCLYEIASSWRRWQRETGADGRVSQAGFDEVLPMYQWASGSLSGSERRYLEAGLSRLDEIPLGWVRPAPKGLKKPTAVRSARSRGASADALNRQLQKAWLENDLVPITDAVVEMPDGWERPDLPTGYGSEVATPIGTLSPVLGRSGPTRTMSVVTKCEQAVDPRATPNVKGSIRTETCGRAAASAWLAYLATGDKRFIDIASGIRDMALQAGSTEGLRAGAASKERLFFETFECWLDGDSDGCYSGL
jgi:hypothetical protein